MNEWIATLIAAGFTITLGVIGWLFKNKIQSIEDILKGLLLEMQSVRVFFARQDEKIQVNQQEHEDIYGQIERHTEQIQRHETKIALLDSKLSNKRTDQ